WRRQRGTGAQNGRESTGFVPKILALSFEFPWLLFQRKTMSFSVDEKTRSSSNFFGGRREAEDCLLIIYGGSGDLAKRKLFPSLANLMLKKQLPKRFKIVAVGRKDMAIDDLLSMGTYNDEFRARFTYVQTDYDAAGVRKLKDVCDAICREDGIPPNYLHYLAIPPKGYTDLARALKAGGFVHPPKDANWSRLVVEKPYGRDQDRKSVVE